MDTDILGSLDKLSPLTIMILGIAYTIGKSVSGDLKEHKKSFDDIDTKIEDLRRDIINIKSDRDRDRDGQRKIDK